jgi:hypothetical protein
MGSFRMVRNSHLTEKHGGHVHEKELVTMTSRPDFLPNKSSGSAGG